MSIVWVRWIIHLLKHQNNPACTKSIKNLHKAEVGFGHYTEEEEEEV